MSKLTNYYAELKAALENAGHTVSKGEFWTPADNKAYIEHTRFKGAKDAVHNLYNLAFTHTAHAANGTTVGLSTGKLSPVLIEGTSDEAEALAPIKAAAEPIVTPLAVHTKTEPVVEIEAVLDNTTTPTPTPEVAATPEVAKSTLNADGSQKVASTTTPTISITGAPADTANIFKE